MATVAEVDVLVPSVHHLEASKGSKCNPRKISCHLCSRARCNLCNHSQRRSSKACEVTHTCSQCSQCMPLDTPSFKALLKASQALNFPHNQPFSIPSNIPHPRSNILSDWLAHVDVLAARATAWNQEVHLNLAVSLCEKKLQRGLP